MLCWKFDVKWAMGGPLRGVCARTCVCVWGVCNCSETWFFQQAGEVRISQRLWAGTCLSETQWRLQTMDLIPPLSPSPSVCLLSFSPVPLGADRRCVLAQCVRIGPICCPLRTVWGALTGPSPRPLLLDTFIWPAQTAFFSPSACLTVTLHYGSHTCTRTSFCTATKPVSWVRAANIHLLPQLIPALSSSLKLGCECLFQNSSS